MKVADTDYIINTVFRTNILPIISECNTSCIFCSHRQNPGEVEVFRMPRMELEDFREIIDFLSPTKKIVIGESATRIVEGEPLLHKSFLGILQLIRNRYPNTPIQVTTNGILLEEVLIRELMTLGGIELNISVNCVSFSKRQQILGLKKDDEIRHKLKTLEDRLKFTGSFVWVPDQLEEADVQEMLSLLEESGAEAVRMFLPGYTYLSETRADMRELYQAAFGIVERLRKHHSIPVIIEPSFIQDLGSRVEGVIQGSPAWNAGIKTGDKILDINGKRVLTRVEAFERAFKLANPALTVLREGEEIRIQILKKKNCPPGFILLYDIHPELVDDVNAAVKRHGADKVLFMTSELAENMLNRLFEIQKPECEYEVLRVSNGYFGGNIKCAGLLTVDDIIDAALAYVRKGDSPDLILLPPIMFDFKKRDLLGKSIKIIEEKLKIPVDTP